MVKKGYDFDSLERHADTDAKEQLAVGWRLGLKNCSADSGRLGYRRYSTSGLQGSGHSQIVFVSFAKVFAAFSKGRYRRNCQIS